MIGLTADCHGVQLPLASWGAGTRRLSALAIAEQNQGDAPITLVDEVERGLEPYRQRTLVRSCKPANLRSFSRPTAPLPYQRPRRLRSGMWTTLRESVRSMQERSRDIGNAIPKLFYRGLPSLQKAQPRWDSPPRSSKRPSAPASSSMAFMSAMAVETKLFSMCWTHSPPAGCDSVALLTMKTSSQSAGGSCTKHWVYCYSAGLQGRRKGT